MTVLFNQAVQKYENRNGDHAFFQTRLTAVVIEIDENLVFTFYLLPEFSNPAHSIVSPTDQAPYAVNPGSLYVNPTMASGEPFNRSFNRKNRFICQNGYC